MPVFIYFRLFCRKRTALNPDPPASTTLNSLMSRHLPAIIVPPSPEFHGEAQNFLLKFFTECHSFEIQPCFYLYQGLGCSCEGVDSINYLDVPLRVNPCSCAFSWVVFVWGYYSKAARNISGTRLRVDRC